MQKSPSSPQTETFTANLGQNFLQSRVADSENPMSPLFGDWLHNDFSVSIHPPNFPPEPVKFPPLTNTTQGIVVMCIPNLLQPPHLRGTNSVFCWSKTSTESTSNPQQEIAKAIVTQYQHCMPKMALAARVNPTINDFKNSLSKLKHQTPDTRTLFHYAAHGAPDVASQYIMLHSQDKLSFDHFPLENVLTATDLCSVHIIDCDHAGALLPAYKSFIEDKREKGATAELFAFFSCGARERLPRSPGLPHDIFTSCMTTPARIALLWHSRHYYCFKNGPLRPLQTDFFQNSPPGVLDDISLILHRLVEAMAFEVFDPDTFMRVFRSDPSIAHLAANFFLASRILSFFGVQPISIPEMPDLKNHQLWHTFDLRLDVALQQLHSPTPEPSLSYPTFLEQSLQTLSHLMNVSTKDIAFPGQLTLIPPALTTPCLQKEGSKVFALYIDKSINAVKQMWYFPIIFPLLQLLFSQNCNEYLLMAVAKALCFMPSARQILKEISPNPFKQILFPLMKEKKPLFVLVISTVLTINNKELIDILLSDNQWAEFVIPLFDNKYTDVKLWTLLFVETFISYVEDKQLQKTLVEKVLNLLNYNNPEIRVAALHAIRAFINSGYDDEIIKSLSSINNDCNVTVRCQLIIVLSNLLASNQNSDDKLRWVNYVDPIMKALVSDPHPTIHGLMENFQSAPKESYVFEWFAQSILSPVKSLLLDYQESTQVANKEINNNNNQSEEDLDDEELLKKQHIKVSEVTLASVQPSSVRIQQILPKPSVSFNKSSAFKYVPTKCSCSTNFAVAGNGPLYYGSNSGDIVAVEWDASSYKTYKVSNSPITHIQGLANNGFPVVISCDADSNISFLNDEFSPVSAFKDLHQHTLFEFLEQDRKLLTYSTKENNDISVYCMRCERYYGSIKSSNGPIRKIRSMKYISDVVAVCSDKLDFYDIRSKDVCLSVDSMPFDISTVPKSPFSFAVANKNGSVSLYDARFNEPIKKFQVAPDNDETLSFCIHPNCSAAAIGTAHGAYVVDLLNGKKYDYTTVPQLYIFQKNISQVNSCLFSPSKFRLALLQNSSDVLIMDE